MDSRSEEVPKHTPGPWEYRKMPQSGYIVFQTWDVPTAGYVKTEADAQLIAAAPLMLEALKMAKSCLDLDISDKVWNLPYTINEASRVAEAAIAKAEGRRP